MESPEVQCNVCPAIISNGNESDTSLQENVSYSWKPSFLSHDDFTFLILEAMNCVMLALDHRGTIKYLSENAAGKLGLSQDIVRQETQLTDLLKDDSLVHKLISQEDSDRLFSVETLITSNPTKEDGGKFQPIRLFSVPESQPEYSSDLPSSLHNCVLQAQTPNFSSEYAAGSDYEFKGIYSLEWKILHLEDKAAAVLGYQPHELLGTSGYNYYHPEDIEYIASAHKMLLKSGTCTTCPYRMSTRGHGWVWLKSHMYICYDQWMVKPIHIQCTHTVPSKEQIESHKTRKEPPEYVTSKPVAKRPRLLHPLSAGTSPGPSRHSDLYSNNLPTMAIHDRREKKYGQQLPKSIPRVLLRMRPPIVSTRHFTLVQQKLYTQLQDKYNSMKANYDLQGEELSQLLHQLNIVAKSPAQETPERSSNDSDNRQVLGAAAMTVENQSSENPSDYGCPWML